MMVNHPTKTFVDIIAGVIAGATVTNILPSISAILAIGWLLIRYYEYFKHNRLGD